MRILHDLSYIYVIMWHIMQVMVREYSRLRMLGKSGKIRESLIAARCYPITFQDWNKDFSELRLQIFGGQMNFWYDESQLTSAISYNEKNNQFSDLTLKFQPKSGICLAQWFDSLISHMKHEKYFLFSSQWLPTDVQQLLDIYWF